MKAPDVQAIYILAVIRMAATAVATAVASTIKIPESAIVGCFWAWKVSTRVHARTQQTLQPYGIAIARIREAMFIADLAAIGA
jgi:hypothetical protein